MMGLSAGEIDTIRATLAEAFGADVQIWLFGSRARGEVRGDVDLYVETPGPVPGGITARLATRRRLEALLHQKVDLIVRGGDDEPCAIDAIAKETGVPL